VTDAVAAEETKRPARAPRRVVVLGVVLYCALAWAALFQLVGFGLSLMRHGDANYAQRAPLTDKD
jgi:hypothetical protein